MNDLLFLRTAAGMTARDTAKALRELFPGIDKSLISKAEHTETYGVELCALGISELRRLAYGEPQNRPVPKQKDRHKNRCRVSARLTDEQFQQLQLHLEKTGESVQDMVLRVVLREIGEVQE